MNVNRTKRRLHHTIGLATGVYMRLPQLAAALHEHRAGYPTGTDEPPVTTSGHGDPTVDKAVRAADGADRAAIAERAIQQHIKTAHQALDAADRLCRFWLADGGDRYQHVDNTPPAPGCAVMARLGRNRNMVGTWEPVHRTSTVGGILDESTPLGLWAYKFVRTNHRLPTDDEALRHHRGERVYVAAEETR